MIQPTSLNSNISKSHFGGCLIARMLERSWRAVPGPLSISPEDIHEVAPQLLATGTGALAWHCIQSLDPPSTGPFLDLRNAYRQHAAESAVHQINTSDIFTRVRAAGIEPVLFKGWGLARLYPDAGLRPYGDIDLWVEDLQELSAALPSGDERVYCVDPHVSFYPQYERSFDDVMRNSHLVNLDDVRVRVPADEDQLRFICLHFLFHGAWRPLWLCDIALMVELTDSNFDWDRCLGGKRKHADWIACAIGLAHQLLGADVSGTPVEKRAQTLPRWLTTAVLKQWEKGNGMSLAESLSFSLPRRLLNPRTLVSAISEHWRNPIQASVEVNAWFNESPRLFFQFVSAFPRIPEFIKYFGTEIRRA